MLKKILSTTLVGSAIIAVVVASISSYRPIPVPFAILNIIGIMENTRFHQTIEVDQAHFSWLPAKNIVELQFENVRILDPRGDSLANVPSVVFGFNPRLLIAGNKTPNYINLVNPVVSLMRSAGGALKVDIGQTVDGAAGTVLENFLIDFAIMPLPSGSDVDAQEIRISDAYLYIEDETTTVKFRFHPVNMTIKTVEEGIWSSLSLHSKTLTDDMVLDIEGLFDTSDHSINLKANLDNIRPAEIADLLPNFRAFSLVEIPVFGRVDLNIDKHFTIQNGGFDIQGETGSLEVGEFSGENLEVEHLQFNGSFTQNFKKMNLDNFEIQFSQGIISGEMSLSQTEYSIIFQNDISISNTYLRELMPLWFAQLDQFPPPQDLTTLSSNLKFNGKYDKLTSNLSGEGRLSYLTDTSMEVIFSQNFASQGTFKTPNFVPYN